MNGGASASATISFDVVVPKGLYPQGDKMILGAYDGYDDTNDTFTTYLSGGFNFTHMYCSDCSASEDVGFLAAGQTAGLVGGFGYLDQPICTSTGTTSGCESSFIDPMAQSSAVAMWGIPEEESDTLSQDQAYYSYIHANDPDHRPVFKYMATHGNPSFLEPIVPYVDVVGEGAYPTYDADCSAPLPPVEGRYTIEQEIAAIQAAGFQRPGPDYQHASQKTPILIPETVVSGAYCSGQPGTTPQSWANEVWNGLAAGAKGYVDYEYWTVANAGTPGLAGPSGVFAQVNELLAGVEGVAEWMIKGTPQSDPMVTVTSGPTTVSNSTGGLSFSYPSVRAAAWDWAGTRTGSSSSIRPMRRRRSRSPGCLRELLPRRCWASRGR